MEPPGLADHEAPLSPGGSGERRLATRLGRARQLVEPACQHVSVVQRADRFLEPLPQRGGAAVLGAAGILDFGRVAQPADPPAQRVEGVRQEALADRAETPQQQRRLCVAESEQAGEHDLGLGGATLLQPAQPAPQAVDVEVEDGGGELPAAARARGPEPGEDRPLFRAGRRERCQAVLQQADDDVEVARGADGTGQPPQHPEHPGEPPGPLAAGQQTEGDTQPPRGDPYLVHGLLVPREGARQLQEHPPGVRAQQGRGSLLGKGVGGHGNITART